MGGPLLETGTMPVEEVAVEDRAGSTVLGGEQQFRQTLEQGLVTTEADLQELVGDRHSLAEHATRLLRIFETQQPGFGQRVDRDDFRAAGLAFSSTDSMRGWLVPGFWPAMRIRSACSRSVTDTEPLPMPMVSDRAVPEDSWHMFEQSGMLLVPNDRIINWYKNAASLEVRPEV